MIEAFLIAAGLAAAGVATTVYSGGKRRAAVDAALRAFLGEDTVVTSQNGVSGVHLGEARLAMTLTGRRPAVMVRMFEDGLLSTEDAGRVIDGYPLWQEAGAGWQKDHLGVGPVTFSRSNNPGFPEETVGAGLVEYRGQLDKGFGDLGAADLLAAVETALRALSAVRRRHDLGAVTVRCPRCRWLPMLSSRGQLGEHVCPTCQGRHLPTEVAHGVLNETLGLSPGDLKAKMGGIRQLSCADCDGDMHALVLEDAIVDVCKSCGAAFFDADELERVTGGRYSG